MKAHWIDAVELLMSCGADPTLRNAEGDSALELARKVAVNWESVRHFFVTPTKAD